jgi:hypothetical protein
MPELEPCKTLAEALAQLQARLPRVAKGQEAKVETKTGGTYKYAYADLTDISEVLLPVLSSLGLSFTACPTIGDGKFVLAYDLHHTSGDGLHGQYPLPTSGTPQQIGSAITYARRYTLCAVTGLAPGGDDDDAAAAEAEHRARPRNVPDAQLAGEGRMTRGEKSAHERLAKETTGGGRPERSRPRGPDPEDPWAQDAPVDGQRAAAMREAMPQRPGSSEAEDQPGSSVSSQWQTLGILYQQLGITERDTRLAEMTDRVGRPISSAKDLSYAEAEAAIRALQAAAEKSKETADA